MSTRSNYQIYPSLLDAWQTYLDAEDNWNEWYGSSDDPKVSCDEYLEQARRELIDRINRVPFESEAADRGTAFNEVIDCLILGRKTEREDMEMTFTEETVTVVFKGQTFVYDANLCRELASDYKGAIPQYQCVGVIPTMYGDVTLYGYIDELLPDSVHDIKTTKNYAAFKFRNHWQHIVYPFCLQYEGVGLSAFQYDVVKWGSGKGWSFFTEYYEYVPERDIPRLREHIEGLLTFVLTHRDLITDKKIFNALEGEDEREKRYGTE